MKVFVKGKEVEKINWQLLTGETPNYVRIPFNSKYTNTWLGSYSKQGANLVWVPRNSGPFHG